MIKCDHYGDSKCDEMVLCLVFGFLKQPYPVVKNGPSTQKSIVPSR
jgi:hypothetical protein